MNEKIIFESWGRKVIFNLFASFACCLTKYIHMGNLSSEHIVFGNLAVGHCYFFLKILYDCRYKNNVPHPRKIMTVYYKQEAFISVLSSTSSGFSTLLSMYHLALLRWLNEILFRVNTLWVLKIILHSHVASWTIEVIKWVIQLFSRFILNSP